MPSRKRNKGRERRSKKVCVLGGWRWMIFGPTWLWLWSPHFNLQDSFFEQYYRMNSSRNIEELFEQQPNVMRCKDNNTMAVQSLASIGTNFLLGNESGVPNVSGYISSALLKVKQCNESTDFVSVSWSPDVVSKSNIIRFGNRRDILKFYHKRISCSCLSTIYHTSIEEERASQGRKMLRL